MIARALRRLGLAALALLGGASMLQAQLPTRAPRRPTTVTRPQPPRGDTLRARRDSTAPRDSAGRDSTALIQWHPADSVLQSLLGRPGYSTTRYQADSITFDVQDKAINLRALPGGHAAVQRDSQLVVTDTSILYSQGTGLVQARGSRIVLRDPSNPTSDLISVGSAQYNLRGRTARVTNPRFAVEMGETWYVSAAVGVVQLPDTVTPAAGDGTPKTTTFYGLGGTLTSCNDSIPDYHFEFKEIKQVNGRTVARPAVLYIKDVPVFWLPFFFQPRAAGAGRQSGVLQPIFSLTDVIRNSPTYRRQVENIGYYWALNDYMDAQLWFDWRSALGGSAGDGRSDPGWMRYNGEWRYRWIDRFITGGIATSYTKQESSNNLAVSWDHNQEFDRDSRLVARVNFVTDTRLQRRNAINPYQAMGTISSNVGYNTKVGPATVSLQGSRTQYPGRSQVSQTLPTLSITTGSLNLASWLVWTPSFNYSRAEERNIDLGGPFAVRYVPEGATDFRLDSLKKGTRNVTASFETPLQIFGYTLSNSFRFSDQLLDYPDVVDIYPDVNDTTSKVRRVFQRRFTTQLDWSPSFSLPSLFRSSWNLVPSLAFQNVESRGAFLIRTEFSNGEWVHQSKRPVAGIGIRPSIFGFFPGFGPFAAIRHAFTPSLTYNYAPKAEVSDEYLRALGRNRAVGYYASLRQSSLTLALDQAIEAKLRSAGDTAGVAAGTAATTGGAGQNLKLLSIGVDPVTYDFERARKLGRGDRGITTENWGYTLGSDLLPGVQLGVRYDLFQGDPVTDTAVFKPYRESITASFTMSRTTNPFVVLARLFGRAASSPATPGQDQLEERPEEQYARQVAQQPVAGSRSRDAQYIVPPTRGWTASFSFSAQRQRPPVGSFDSVQTDPARLCAVFRDISPFAYDNCLAQARTNPNTQQTPVSPTIGGVFTRSPPISSLSSNIGMALTRNWSANWQTQYDIVRSEFASHVVSLQRELHDWRAHFNFTQSPNGNFAFSFFIALKAQPELKFDYNRASYRGASTR